MAPLWPKKLLVTLKEVAWGRPDCPADGNCAAKWVGEVVLSHVFINTHQHTGSWKIYRASEALLQPWGPIASCQSRQFTTSARTQRSGCARADDFIRFSQTDSGRVSPELWTEARGMCAVGSDGRLSKNSPVKDEKKKTYININGQTQFSSPFPRTSTFLMTLCHQNPLSVMFTSHLVSFLYLLLLHTRRWRKFLGL